MGAKPAMVRGEDVLPGLGEVVIWCPKGLVAVKLSPDNGLHRFVLGGKENAIQHRRSTCCKSCVQDISYFVRNASVS